jgi:hypothetical protein
MTASETRPPGGIVPEEPARRLWREVVDRAGGQCECRGGCGRKHKDGGGRCKHLNTSHAPLCAVPREPVPTRIAATLPAADLQALCRRCHDGIAAARAAARAAALADQSATGSLF